MADFQYPVELFQNRKALLVTKHGKERVISPILKEFLELEVVVTKDIDTDQFGTFSGEMERPDNQYNTARLKAVKGFEHYPEFNIAIASEGSFNPHPDSSFIPIDMEIVMLVDKKYGLEITGRYLTLAPMIKEGKVCSVEEALEFAEIIGFPEYGVVIKAIPGINSTPFVFKDATTRSALEVDLVNCFSMGENPHVSIQSDMRAHRNPFRMENIRRATLELINTIKSVCPECHTPGFDVKEVRPGLPCSLCRLPTKSTLSYIYKCAACRCREERYYPHGKKQEDPGFCDQCNP